MSFFEADYEESLAAKELARTNLRGRHNNSDIEELEEEEEVIFDNYWSIMMKFNASSTEKKRLQQKEYNKKIIL